MIDFGKILKRAWHILWNYRILWIFGILLAITTGGGGGKHVQIELGFADIETDKDGRGHGGFSPVMAQPCRSGLGALATVRAHQDPGRRPSYATGLKPPGCTVYRPAVTAPGRRPRRSQHLRITAGPATAKAP